MTPIAPLVSVVLLAASLPGVHAGPACAHKHYKNPECLSTCKTGWGWSSRFMGNDRWGGVMRKPTSNETLDDIISRACGFEPTATASPSLPVGNVQTGSVTLIPTTISAAVSSVTSPTSVVPVSVTTSASNSSHSLVLVLSTASSTASPHSSTSTKHLTASVSAPASSKTSSTSSATLTSVHSTAKVHSTSAIAQSSAVASASSTSSSGTSSNDIDAYLTAHNTVRADHGAAALTWSENLASKAQSWADKCVFEHSGGSLGPYGENLAAGTGSSYGIQTAIKSWTDEVSEYDPSNPVASHFTQVVWKSTTQVGCAVQSCSGIFSASYGLAKFYVCEYSPQGNIIGEFAENVQA